MQRDGERGAGWLSCCQPPLEQGARRLVYLAGFLELHAISRRLSGIQKAVAAAGASLRVAEAPSLKIGSGREVGLQVLRSSSVDGVVCPSDPLAIGVIQAATDLGIGVPEELLVVGYDDDHFASESDIPVSTVSQPGRRMGELAIELLLEEIREGWPCPPNDDAGPAPHPPTQQLAITTKAPANLKHR